jgi:hypothetical protein
MNLANTIQLLKVNSNIWISDYIKKFHNIKSGTLNYFNKYLNKKKWKIQFTMRM